MINFRYHVVSMIAVFLALGIGIIMGTAVIDRAVVDRLERQQSGLQSDVNDVQAENNRLREELREERDAARQLAEEGSERLLDNVLLDVPVVLVGYRDDETDSHDELVSLLNRADASYRGTLWFTDRFTLDDDDERRDLATALSLQPDATVGTLRASAIDLLADQLRSTSQDAVVPDNDATPPDDAPAAEDPDALAALVEAGFVHFQPAEGADDALPVIDRTTRLVVVSGADATAADRGLLVPLVRALVLPRSEMAPVGVLAATGAAASDDDAFLEPIRQDEAIRERMSTVDGIDDFAGRVASVLAIADLGDGRFGHYGRGPGSERLLPAPAE